MSQIWRDTSVFDNFAINSTRAAASSGTPRERAASAAELSAFRGLHFNIVVNLFIEETSKGNRLKKDGTNYRWPVFESLRTLSDFG